MRLLLLLGLVCGTAHALGDREKLVFGQIAYAGNWNPRASGVKRLAWEIEKRTSIETVGEPAEVRLSDENSLKRCPFLFLSGDGALPNFDDLEVARLRKQLSS